MALLQALRTARWAGPFRPALTPFSAPQIRGKKKKARAAPTGPADGTDADVVNIADLNASMDKVVGNLERGLSRLRTSGANAAILDGTKESMFCETELTLYM